MTQKQLFDDIESDSCPECRGVVTVTDPIVNVARCEKCGLVVIKDRGRWQDFRHHFGGGAKAIKKRKRPKRAA